MFFNTKREENWQNTSSRRNNCALVVILMIKISFKSDLNSPQTGQSVEYCKSDFQRGGPRRRRYESEKEGMGDLRKLLLLAGVCGSLGQAPG